MPTRSALAAENRRLKAVAHDLRTRLDTLQAENLRLGGRLKQVLEHKRFRHEALSYMLAHPNVDETTAFIAQRLLILTGCDRLAVGGADGTCRTWTRDGASYPDCGCFHRCPTCPLLPGSENIPDILVVPDVRRANGTVFPEGCLAKSVASLLVRTEGAPWCRLTLHYVDRPHVVDEHEMRSLQVGADIIVTALERRRLVTLQEAETTLRIRALEKAPISAYIKDADCDYRYVFVNDFTLARLGLRREEIIGKTDFDFLPAATAEAYRRNDEAATSADSLSTHESYADCTGRTCHVQSFRCSARDANGHRLVIGYSLDLTELFEKQGRIEALQLAAEKERDRAVAAERTDNFIAQLLKHVVSLPPETNPMDSVLAKIGSFAGAGRCGVYYYRLPGTVADNVYEWCAPGVASVRKRRQGCDFARLPDFQREIAAGRVFAVPDCTAADPATSAILRCLGVYALVAAPIFDEEGTVVGFTSFSFPEKSTEPLPKAVISGLHEAVDVISVCRMRSLAFDAAQAAERAKTDFFASISHDIRTPLNAIIGFSELLKNEKDPDLRNEYLDDIAFSGKTLLELVDDILDLARLDAGRIDLADEPFDFKLQAGLVLRSFEAAAREKGITLRLEAENLPIVRIDGRRIRQILFNLVGNAVKYTDAGNVTVSAAFESQAEDRGLLRISVRDTGIGIAPEDTKDLMVPYVRLHAANARGGTGLGLSICKRIVEAMGGSVTISSEPGRGSVFAVLIPNVHRQKVLAPSESAPSESTAASFATLRVLVVDDLEMNRRVLSASCRQLGVGRIATAASSSEALSTLAKESFDLVLTDMKMPGMDGGSFIRALRGNPALAHLVVFLVTADVEAKKYYRDLGADGVLLKPFVQSHLAETLSAARILREAASRIAPATTDGQP